MKRIGYITLAILCLLQSGGMLLIDQSRQCYIQSEMLQALKDPNSQFQKLTLALSDFQKNKINAYEISIDGEMFDVKSANITGDQVELLAMRDTKEEGILKDIKRAIGFTKNNDQKIPNHLLVLLNMVYLTNGSYHSFFFQEKNIQHGIRPILSIISRLMEIVTPPPDQV